MKKRLPKYAFTVLSTVTVTSLIGISSIAGTASYNGYTKNSRDVNRISDIRSLQSAITQYYFNYNEYPLPSKFSSDGEMSRYINPIPTDTKSGEKYISQDGKSTILDYSYAVGKNENGIRFQIYELSTGFESNKNVKERAKDDYGNDDLRYESTNTYYSGEKSAIQCKDKLSNGSENPFKCTQDNKETAIGIIINQKLLNGDYDKELEALESKLGNSQNQKNNSNNLKNYEEDEWDDYDVLDELEDWEYEEFDDEDDLYSLDKDYGSTPEKCFTFDKTTRTITNYDKSCGSKVTIPTEIGGLEVRNIGESAFANKDLTEVVISNTIKRVLNKAFYGNNLTKVTLKSGITVTIGQNVFVNKNGKDISSVVKSEGGTIMSDGGNMPTGSEYVLSESEKSQFTKESCFTFNSSTKTITDYDKSCGSKVVIPTEINGVDVVNISQKAFANKDLTEVVIANSIKKIYNEAFYGNDLTKVTLKSGTTVTIGQNVFVNKSGKDISSVIKSEGGTIMSNGGNMVN